MTAPQVHGHVAAGFEKVADAFAANFRHHGDTGAACAVYAGGAPMVDIWAGHTVRGPWAAGTRSVLFSASKGITTICVLMAVEAGHIDLDAPVATYWPAYGSHGKETTTVRQLLAHRAGLPAPEKPLTGADLAAWQPVADALAEQAPLWRPGSEFAYHPLTFGYLAGELLHRTTGQRPAAWFGRHIAEPLQLHSTFGVDATASDFAPMGQSLPDAAARVEEDADLELVDRAMTMGGALGLSAADIFETANSPAFLSVELAAGNLVGSARDLARVYAATIGGVDGTLLLQADTVRDAREPRSWGTSYLGIDDQLRWGTGFMIDSPRRRMAGPGSFGHDGAGGQLGFANLELGVSFAYQTIRPGGVSDDRAESLCRALRACL